MKWVIALVLVIASCSYVRSAQALEPFSLIVGGLSIGSSLKTLSEDHATKQDLLDVYGPWKPTAEYSVEQRLAIGRMRLEIEDDSRYDFSNKRNDLCVTFGVLCPSLQEYAQQLKLQ
tara:strand:- start:5501 stop:5851 length:351 start_codon:yes stop_codon:yes gene_type:complete